MPHKLGNLWPQIADYDALRDAWREVRSGKGHKAVVLRYESNLAVNLSRLEARLQDGSYCPREHYEFWIIAAVAQTHTDAREHQPCGSTNRDGAAGH